MILPKARLFLRLFLRIDVLGPSVLCLNSWRRWHAFVRSWPMRYSFRRVSDKVKAALTVSVALFVMAGVGMQWGAPQVCAFAGPLSDGIAYEGAQGCFDDPGENDDLASFASVAPGEKNPPSVPLSCSSLLSRFAPFQNSHHLPFSLRC